METRVAVMAGDENVAVQAESAQLEFEQICGELDAAIVFAAATEEEYRTGNAAEFGEVCRSDANGCYAAALERMSKAHLTEDQRRVLVSKLDHLEQSLHRLRSIALPPENEAA